MGQPVLCINLYAQQGIGIEYQEATKMGILAAIELLGQTINEDVTLRIDPRPESDEPNLRQCRPVSMLLEMAKESAISQGHPRHLDLGVLMQELRKRWGASDGLHFQFLLVRDPYVAPIRKIPRQIVCRAEDCKVATISIHPFEKGVPRQTCMRLFTMMVLRLTAQLCGGPNEDRVQAHNAEPCLMQRRNSLYEYERDLYPLYTNGEFPFCHDCLLTAIGSLATYRMLSEHL
jgi:hypothetical protein